MQTKVIIWIASVSLALAILGYGIHRIDQHGYDRCRAEDKVAIAAAAEKARANVVTVEKHYAPILKSIQTAPDSGVPVGPLTTSAIDGLR